MWLVIWCHYFNKNMLKMIERMLVKENKTQVYFV